MFNSDEHVDFFLFMKRASGTRLSTIPIILILYLLFTFKNYVAINVVS